MVTAGTSVNYSLIKFCYSSHFFFFFLSKCQWKEKKTQTSFSSLQNRYTCKYSILTIEYTKYLQGKKKKSISGAKEKYKYLRILHIIPEHSPRRYLLQLEIPARLLVTQNSNLEKNQLKSFVKNIL